MQLPVCAAPALRGLGISKTFLRLLGLRRLTPAVRRCQVRTPVSGWLSAVL